MPLYEVNPNDIERDQRSDELIANSVRRFQEQYDPRRFHMPAPPQSKPTVDQLNMRLLQDQAVRDADHSLWHSFVNGFAINSIRGLIGVGQMITESQIEKMNEWSRENDVNFEYKENPFEDITKSSALTPYEVVGETPAQQFMVDLASGASQLASQWLVAGLTGGAGGLAFMGSQIAGNQYIELRNKGVDVDVASTASLANAAIQSPLEYLSLRKIMGRVPTRLQGRLLSALEIGLTEGGTEFLQEFPDQLSGLIAENWEGKSLEEIAQLAYEQRGEILNDALYSGAIGALLGLGGGGVGRAARSILNWNTNRQTHKASLNYSIERSDAIRESGADPKFAAEVINANLPGQTVLIDGEALYQYAQGQGMDKAAEILGVTEDQLADAAAKGQDIEINLGNYDAAGAAFPNMKEALGKETSFDNGSYSPSKEEIERVLQRDIEEAKRDEMELNRIMDTLEMQMREAKIPAAQGREIRRLYRQWVGSMAFQQGVSAQEFATRHPLIVRRAGTMKRQSYNQVTNHNLNIYQDVTPVDMDALADKIPNRLDEEGNVKLNQVGKPEKDVVGYIRQLNKEMESIPSADLQALLRLPSRDRYGIRHLNSNTATNLQKTLEWMRRRVPESKWKKTEQGLRKKVGKNRTIRNKTLSNLEEVLGAAHVVEVALDNSWQKNKEGEAQEHKKAIKAFYRLVVPIKIDGEYRTMMITAEDTDGRISFDPHTLELYQMDLRPNKISPEPSQDLPKEGGYREGEGSEPSFMLAHFLENVNDLNHVPYVVLDTETGRYKPNYSNISNPPINPNNQLDEFYDEAAEWLGEGVGAYFEGTSPSLMERILMQSQLAWHGAQNTDFSHFDDRRFRSGEGHMAHGHGWYVAIKRGTAVGYQMRGKGSFDFSQVPNLTEASRADLDYLVHLIKMGWDKDFEAARRRGLKGTAYREKEFRRLSEDILGHIKQINQLYNQFKQGEISALDFLDEVSSYLESNRGRGVLIDDIGGINADSFEDESFWHFNDLVDEITHNREYKEMSASELDDAAIQLGDRLPSKLMGEVEWLTEKSDREGAQGRRLKKLDFSEVKKTTPTLMRVEVPGYSYMLDEDARFNRQPKIVQDAIYDLYNDLSKDRKEDLYKEFLATHPDSFLAEYIRTNPGVEDRTPLNEGEMFKRQYGRAVHRAELLRKNKPSLDEFRSEYRPWKIDGRDMVKYGSVAEIRDYFGFEQFIDGDGQRMYENILVNMDGFKTAKDPHRELIARLNEELKNIKDRHNYINFRLSSELLADRGVKGIKYNGFTDGPCAVIFHGDDIKIVQKYDVNNELIYNLNNELDAVYEQTRGNLRGAFRPNVDGKSIIEILPTADATTMIHELGHFFFEALSDDVKNGYATEQQVKDFDTLLKYGGMTAEQWYATDTNGRREAHERVAEAFETYLMEGKAPSKELHSAFQKIKEWMLNVYQTIWGPERNLQNAIPLTEEVREVFGRMLAARQQIQEMERINGYFTHLDDKAVEAMGKLSPQRQTSLLNAAAKARETAVNILTKEAMKNFKEDRLAAIIAYRQEILPHIQEQVMQESLYSAETKLENFSELDGDIKSLPEMFPMDFIEAPTAQECAAKYLELARKVKTSDVEYGYVSAFNMLAEQHGFSSGEQMATAIIEAPTYSQEVTARVEAAINQKFPDVMAERAAAEEAARRAIYNDDTGMLLSMEAQLIEDKIHGLLEGQENAERNKQRATVRRELAKNVAHDDMRNNIKLTKATKPKRFINAERKAASKVAEMLAKKKDDDALKWKNVQLYNHYCAAEAYQISAIADHWRDQARKMVLAKKETWGNEENFAQVQALLMRLGARQHKDYRPDMRTMSFDAYLASMEDTYGCINVPDWLRREDMYLPHPEMELSFSQMQDVMNTLDNIRSLVKMQSDDLKWNKDLTFGQAKAQAIETLEKLKTKYEPKLGGDRAGTIKEAAAFKADFYNACLQSPEILCEKIDGWTQGFFSKNVFTPIKHCADAEANMRWDYQVKEAQIYKELIPDKDTAAAYEEKFSPEELGGAAVDKFTLMQMAMNLGNQGNVQRLCETTPLDLQDSRLWVPGDVDRTKRNLINFLGRYLTKADWTYVQKHLDIIGGQWEQLRDVKKNREGFTPEKVEAVPFEVVTADGERIIFRGGYFPLVRDSRLGSRPISQPVQEGDEQMGRGIRTMKVDSGSMKERSKQVAYPVDLRWGCEYKRIEENMHYICYTETMDLMRRFMNDKEIYSLLKEKLGPNEVRAFREWLEKAADPRSRGGDMGEAGISDTLNWIRSKTTTCAIMLNLKVITQNFGNVVLYGNAVEDYTWKDSFAAYGTWLRAMQDGEGWRGAQNFVFEKSVFMRERSVIPDITLKDVIASSKLNPVERTAIDLGAKAMVFTDNMTAVPNWIQAYQKKINAGATEQEAVDFADMVVRRTLGSNRATELAAVFSSDAKLVRLFTMFQTFFNTQYNQWAREANIYLKTRDKARLAQFLLGKWFMFSFLNLIFSGINPFHEDDDDYLEITKEVALYPTTLVSGAIGNIAGEWLKNASGMRTFGFRLSAMQNTVESWDRVFSAMHRMYAGKAVNKQEVIEPLTGALGLGIGLPSQINKWFWNAYDILFNDMTPEVEDLFRRRPRRER